MSDKIGRLVIYHLRSALHSLDSRNDLKSLLMFNSLTRKLWLICESVNYEGEKDYNLSDNIHFVLTFV